MWVRMMNVETSAVGCRYFPHKPKPNARLVYNWLVGGRLSSASRFTDRSDTDKLIGPFNALLYALSISCGFIDFTRPRSGTPLSTRVREVVILSVGAIWTTAYEKIYSPSGHGAGRLSAGIVAALAAR